MNKPHLSLALAFYSAVFKDFIVHDPSNKTSYKTSARYLLQRLETEGLSLLTRALPEMGKAMETSLITGEVFVTPPYFSKHWRSELPNFMYGCFRTLFDDSGHPLGVESAEAVYCFFALRQVCLAYSKVTDIPSRMTLAEAEKAFRERIVEEPTITAPSWLLNKARALIQGVVMEDGRLQAMLAQWVENPYGKHGPGAVAGKEHGLSKWDFRMIRGTNPLLYRFNDRAAPISGSANPFSRLAIVPKDFKSLRSICIEPKEFQFAQQGLWDVLKSLIHENPLTRRSINFNHQEYNGRLCKRSDIATIDLKDASDRVRLKLCRLLFPKEFYSLVTRYRSREIEIGNDRVRPTCFASMGSALCFPIETLVFWALAQAAVHPRTSRKPLRVFGDDIVCPREDAPYIAKVLETCGLKVNVSKTCIRTPIRESCGAFTYAGSDVSIVRFKNTTVSSPRAWISLVESCKLLAQKSCSRASYAMLLQLKQFWHVPFGHFGFPKSQDGFSCQSRWNPDLQRREWRMPRLVTRYGNEKLRDMAGLYAWLVGNSTKPSSYGTDKVKMGWVADYTE